MSVTAADVKDELAVRAEAVGLTASEFDSLLSDLIDRETERVEDAIDVVLSTETVTADLSRPLSVEEYLLPLPDRPVQSVASVSIDTDRAGGDDVSASEYRVEDTHLELIPDNGVRDSWPTQRRSITVEYTHGYPDGSEPEPINGAIIGLVRHAIQEIESDGVNSENIDGQSVDYELGDDVVRRHIYRARQFDEPDFYGGTQVI
jgi:hypothetical protein